MFFWVKTFFAAFLLVLVLFFKVEFQVYPHLPLASTQPLISNLKSLPDKVVLIIVDSLRYDYIPRFSVVKNTQQAHPKSTFLAKSKVGNPTMTTQRIESLMTGSQIFSSGNILKTFLASQVDADNIISQLNSKGRESAVLGDNTWVKLYQFTNSDVCTNTFDVHDLDTCDKVVYDNLDKYLKNKNTSFIVAHLLGIDHVGHSTSSLTAPSMSTKISEFSQYLSKLFQQSSPNTLFLMTGDHGMRSDGNHGGTSKEQVETFLFGYLKGGQLFQDKPKKLIAHSDITTTLALLLDLPLPNNAIGYPILNLLPAKTTKKDIALINQNLLKHFSDMLRFYSNPLSTEDDERYRKKLNEKNSIDDQEIILEFISQKLTFLKYSTPDPTATLVLALLLSILPVSILVHIFFPQLHRTLTSCKGKYYLTLFCEGFPMFTLFICYFSWAVIQNLSNALVSGFFIAAIFGVLLSPLIKEKLLTIGVVLGIYFVLAQMEPDKSNDYKPSFLRIQFLNDIVISKGFLWVISTGTLIWYLYQNWRGQRVKDLKELDKNMDIKVAEALELGLCVVSYINYNCSHILNDPFYLLSIFQTIAIIAGAFLMTYRWITPRSLFLFKRILVVTLLSLFMGPNFPIVIAATLIIENSMWRCYNYAIFMSLLAKCTWWWLGNRYQYSGVDILKTYVYSQQYAIVLNAVSLIIYLNSPFLLGLALINTRMLQSKTQKAIREDSYSAIESEEENEEEEISGEMVDQLQEVNMKFSGVLLLGLVSSVWTTLYNNQKILFTVVCVPVLVLISLVTLSTLVVVLILSYQYKNKAADRSRNKNTYSSLEQLQ